jgi:hypothetical protein
MANPEHVSILIKGVKNWNVWRTEHPKVRPDLSEYDFTQIQPTYFEDSSGNRHSDQLREINLRGADLRRAVMSRQNLFGADLSRSDLEGAVLNDTIIKFADLRKANLRGANLKGARLIDADLSGADLSGAFVFGASSWKVNLTAARQKNLIITPSGAPEIVVDNLDVAHAVYMLFEKRQKIAEVIKTIGERAVLLLGRFTNERKEILDAVADKLRQLKLLPIIFDFAPLPNRDYTETIKILAGLSNFVIADITQPKSIPQEAQAIIPDFKIPFFFVIQDGERAWSMSADFLNQHWVFGPFSYADKVELVANLEKLLVLAEKKNRSLSKSRAVRRSSRPESIKDL